MNTKTRILVVDDEPRLIRLVKANLEPSGYEVLAAFDGVSAINLVERQPPDLILLDIMLPGIDGFEVCQRLREFTKVPIIMLTAKAEEVDKVKGLELGADDYLTKPFGIEELLARIKAVLRRIQSPEETKQPPTLVFGDLTIDLVKRRVLLRGKDIVLTPTEYSLLHQLSTNAGRVMLHEELLSKVWGPEYRNELEYLRVYIRYLRQKIEDDPANPQRILSRPGIGYLFQSPSLD
ncbi:MAG: response regulator transcription factor [Chloroflexi bacterium]|nr:response regulator transcription factor [Chloroflexota bacterium]